MALAGAA